MANTNQICREILNTRDVILQRVAEVLITDLVTPGTLDKATASSLTKRVEQVVHAQSQQLVDRVVSLSG